MMQDYWIPVEDPLNPPAAKAGQMVFTDNHHNEVVGFIAEVSDDLSRIRCVTWSPIPWLSHAEVIAEELPLDEPFDRLKAILDADEEMAKMWMHVLETSDKV